MQTFHFHIGPTKSLNQVLKNLRLTKTYRMFIHLKLFDLEHLENQNLQKDLKIARKLRDLIQISYDLL